MNTPATNPQRANLRWFLRPCDIGFDTFARAWESDSSRQFRAWVILGVFVGVGLWIGAGRIGWLPNTLIIDKPFGYAIHAAFTLVLVTEVVSMVLSLSDSVADSVGKQFEIFSLILLRQAFEEFSHRGDHVDWVFAWDAPVTHMIVDIAGAIGVFALASIYNRMQLHRPITSDEDDQRSFVAAKKLVALALLSGLSVIVVMSISSELRHTGEIPLFKSFYLLLIFADVLIVLLALRYSASHAVVFRNAGFAACTLLIRVALSAPPFLNAAIGIAAAGLLIALSAAYRHATYSNDALTEKKCVL